VFVQALVAETAVEALDESVLDWHAELLARRLLEYKVIRA
jgi:hypothetical protein